MLNELKLKLKALLFNLFNIVLLFYNNDNIIQNKLNNKVIKLNTNSVNVNAKVSINFDIDFSITLTFSLDY
jgi:hypothetical protein